MLGESILFHIITKTLINDHIYDVNQSKIIVTVKLHLKTQTKLY